MSDQAAGWWADPDGSIHIDIDVMLAANGYEINDQTRAALTAAWEKFAVDHDVLVEVITDDVG